MPTRLRIALVLATALFVLSPILLIAWQSVQSDAFFKPNAQLSLSAFKFVLTDPDFYASLWNSAQVAVGMTLIAVPLGSVLAFLLTRTDVPGGRWIEPLVLVPMFISSLVLAFGYVVGAGPVGFLSLAAKSVLGSVQWTLYSKPSIIIIAGLTHVPHVYLYVSTALKGVGSDIEEAARVSGASPWRVALTVSLPMVLPTILFCALLLLFLGIELFGLPLVLGEPEGISVLATYLFKLTNLFGTPAYHLLAAVAMLIVAMTLPMVYLQRKMMKDGDRFVSVKGKAAARKLLSLGPMRWVAFGAIVAWLAVSVVLPVGAVILRSVLRTWGDGVPLAGNFTAQHFLAILEFPNLQRGIVNTALMATLGAALSVGVYTMVNLSVHRWKSRWAATIDYLVLLPRALPGLVAGLAMFWMFLFIPLISPLRSTLLSVWIAYTLVWLGYGIRLISGPLMQISRELEEAARVAGASPGRVSMHVTLPLVRAALVGAWALIFITYVKEYSTAVYLLAPGTEVLGSLMISLWDTGAIDTIAALSTINICMVGIGVLLLQRFEKASHAQA
ncbi:iron ABC transporter permease [Ramlibacter sp. G-1-2-2]|uniref:Iron ABC transporter permease n=1 Tax=Ramlibacter agri TaxID=2728837 RepID=A0A848GY68_9BURK|nr:iron ABC transporter permease [Ramlibacter agri]NML42259.1 iron ABC transporter permease [Ramlibacter agri]